MNNTLCNAYIVDGNITLFLGSHSESFKRDILHSNLLAYLISNANCVSSEKWHSKYKESTGMFCWVTRSSRSATTGKQACSLNGLIERAIGDTSYADNIKSIHDALSIVKNLPEDSPALSAFCNRWQLTDINSDMEILQHSSTLSPMITVILTDGMIVSLHIVLNVATPVDLEFIDNEIPSENLLGDILIRHTTSHFSTENYDNLRDIVISKLGNTVNTRIFEV